MAKKGSSKGQQAHYTKYKTEKRHSINKKRRMARHLKNHPNDEQTARAMKGEITYSRQKPKGNTGASKKELEANSKLTIGKRKVYDSKGFVVKGEKCYTKHIEGIRDKFNKLGINNGRDFNRKIA